MIQIKNTEGHVNNYYTVGEISKILMLHDAKGKLIGRNTFYKMLKTEKILMQDNTFYQSMLNLDMGIMHEVVKSHKIYYIPIFNEKGLAYLKNKYGGHGKKGTQISAEVKDSGLNSIKTSNNSLNSIEVNNSADDLLELLTEDQYKEELQAKYGYGMAYKLTISELKYEEKINIIKFNES